MRKIIHVKNRVLALEVLKKSEIAFPCSVGSNICFASHRAWERENLVFQHLCSRKANFLACLKIINTI